MLISVECLLRLWCVVGRSQLDEGCSDLFPECLLSGSPLESKGLKLRARGRKKKVPRQYAMIMQLADFSCQPRGCGTSSALAMRHRYLGSQRARTTVVDI